MPNNRFATFNLYQFAKPPVAWYEPENTYSDSEWDDKTTWIKEQLEALDADVVGFQEVFSSEDLKELVSDQGYPHFEAVDTPEELGTGSNVFGSPVVALASRHPIAAAEAVTVDGTIVSDLPVADGFKFSRTPIRASVDVPGLGPTTIYVAHLKSKRPLVTEPDFAPGTPWDVKVRESMRARSRGQVASLLQRAAESAALYHDLTSVLASDENRPIVVLGDLNDDQGSITIEALSNRDHIYEIDGVAWSDLPSAARRTAYSHKLSDAFDLAPNPTGAPRPATHFHRGQGGILDYIFVSNAFVEANSAHVARVSSHEVLGTHLEGDGVGDQRQSDHAQVVIEVETI